MTVLKIFILIFGVFLLVKMTLKGKIDLEGIKNNMKRKKGKKTSGDKVLVPQKVKKLRGKRLFFVVTVYSLIAIVFLIVGVFIYYSQDLPDPNKINNRIVNESTKIYDRTGEHLLYDIHGEERRTIIPFEEMPGFVRYATIVLEDDIFYSHGGFDVGGIIKAVCHEASSTVGLGDLGGLCPQRGGSTITQQFIKNTILTSERRYSRKLKELVLAIEIERKFEKDEILWMYLNEIPYGANAYGVEAAAQTYFGVHAKELSLAQSAMLACLPNAPTYYSPHGSHTDRLLSRWSYTLNQMEKLGYITAEQLEEAKNQDVLSQVKPFRDDIRAPHFVLYVKEKLVEEFGEEEIQKGGFKVYTTLDWTMQEMAEKAVREGVENHGERWGFSNAALVATNPKNGHVLAMVGSKDYFNEEIDGNVNVAIRLRQPGSSFKPYVYAAAFQKGYTPETYLFDVKTNFGKGGDGKEYKPENYDGSYRGPVKMKNALAMSLNVPAVKALYLAGVDNSVALSRNMGITTLDDPDRLGLSVVLGGGEVKLLDHVAAFGVFANEGIKHEQGVVLRIEDNEGNIIKEYKDTGGGRVLEKEVAQQITYILSQDKYRAPAFGAGSNLSVPGVAVAAKTGTTNEYRDGWLVGATPSLSAGVWAGNNDNTAMKPGAAGVNVAGPVWNQFMREATKNYQKEDFTEPEEVETGKAMLDGEMDFVEELDVCEYKKDKYCLLEDEDDCDDEDDIDEKKFFVGHNILYYVDKDDPRGDRPDKPKNDSQYKDWEEGVLEWAEEHADGKGRDIAPDDEC